METLIFSWMENRALNKNVKWAYNLGIFNITDEQHTGVHALTTASFFFPENKMNTCLQWLEYTESLSKTTFRCSSDFGN